MKSKVIVYERVTSVYYGVTREEVAEFEAKDSKITMAIVVFKDYRIADGEYTKIVVVAPEEMEPEKILERIVYAEQVSDPIELMEEINKIIPLAGSNYIARKNNIEDGWWEAVVGAWF